MTKKVFSIGLLSLKTVFLLKENYHFLYAQPQENIILANCNFF
ncbi:hypothetical protein NT03LS_2823 [Listeria seeligeri FSL N1-067]|uniref:Uncharacterized protein n=1 Tax=Listeria seeligeri FSL N1-067 TaxID=702453 RepID=E3ZTG6_LISSE|nr:hypothetical protein NT03LS_2823 [Listeria seeligeri FSL N1-067]